MKFFNFFKREEKQSEARKVATFFQRFQAQTTPVNYENLARKGFASNAIVYAAISKTATSCAGIRWGVFRKERGGQVIELDAHPLLTLLERPNAMQSMATFIETLIGQYRLTGNLYIEAVRPNTGAPPVEIWPVRPDKMKVIPGAIGLPYQYEFNHGGIVKRWDVDQVNMASDILHMKSFNPLNDWYGMSPLQSAMLSLDQNNDASRWNLALLQNSATPSGLLKVQVSTGNPRGTLSDEAFRSLKKEFDDNYGGATNAGRPMILEGGLDWQSISLSPKDMEFIQAKNLSAGDLALVYGVPGEILGIGQKTFNNYREARLSFYEETILPLMDNLRDELNRWLIPAFGGDVYLDYDIDSVEALTYRREQKFATVLNANFLTQNEKREAVGYAPKDGWDVFLIGSQLLETPDDMSDLSIPFMRPRSGDDDTTPPPPGAESDPGDDDDDSTAKGFKFFNLVNNNEKRRSWRSQNVRKDALARAFERDLALDFNIMNAELIKAATTIKDPQLATFEMAKVIQDNMESFEKTLRHHINRSADEFGLAVLGEGKQVFNIVETKANRYFESFVHDYTSTRSGQAITTIFGTTQKRIQEVVGVITQDVITEGETLDEFTNRLTSKLNVESRARARTIARTEVQLATNNASREAIRSLEIPNMQKEWVSANDGRVRDSHDSMNGEKADLDDTFTTPDGNVMDGPGDPGAPAEEVINCRCALVYRSSNPVR